VNSFLFVEYQFSLSLNHEIHMLTRDVKNQGWVMVFYATFNNISVILWRSVLMVGETGVFGENHRTVASCVHTLSHNVVSSIPYHQRDSN
jgi:hypothetical protein